MCKIAKNRFFTEAFWSLFSSNSVCTNLRYWSKLYVFKLKLSTDSSQKYPLDFGCAVCEGYGFWAFTTRLGQNLPGYVDFGSLRGTCGVPRTSVVPQNTTKNIKTSQNCFTSHYPPPNSTAKPNL